MNLQLQYVGNTLLLDEAFYGEISIPELKKQLNQQQLAVRIDEL